MPQVTIKIGGRSFDVACQEGEEHYLHSAAEMLNTEAEALSSQIGRMPESRMLLMAGLMLADKTAVLEDKVRDATDRMAALQGQIDTLETASHGQAPGIPQELTDAMEALAARAEALADEVEAKAGEKSLMPWRMFSSARTLTSEYSIPMKFSTPATREEKPHCGIDLVPFMNRTTSLLVTVSLI